MSGTVMEFRQATRQGVKPLIALYSLTTFDPLTLTRYKPKEQTTVKA